jgi:hypothetical protein
MTKKNLQTYPGGGIPKTNSVIEAAAEHISRWQSTVKLCSEPSAKVSMKKRF